MQLNNYLDAEKILPELKILIQENSKFLQDVYTNYEYNHTIAKIYLHQKKYALALTAIDSSLKKFNPNLKKFFSSSTYLLQSEIYDSLKNY